MATIANPNIVNFTVGDPNQVGPAPTSDNVAALPPAPAPTNGVNVDQSSLAEARLARPVGVQMRPQVTDFRATVRPYDWVQVNPVRGDMVLLVEEDRTGQIGNAIIDAPQWMTPTVPRVEPQTWRGD